ncbi:hypothetical protein FT663_00684 [Candidozyma haemuli var. vulneris]|uniref:Brix domain-containing protein n=1 Tax=Candidozyma haemuli TaxID=45357 RepID=A0A2V1APP8_9ASCO|nr:hypothetical protein CXQ85_003717 [[Candida] haemuloni]KAF3987522.1 hypothetical protein FT662_03955 [[Candida] haemuloni var. vulneris]KAF3995141.1 hypothetical protein FT663_00684 [[Candida] haemuloni var. vulneris]PVH19859.1 hypothetical protein CXQ85_003717 [[Candida] haemuloni]
MAKRRTKRRTHQAPSTEELAKIPRSMVISLGTSLKNHALTQLVKDFRFVMQPHTAISLRERKANKLKDFMVMSGPLAVSDLFVFKQSESSGNVSLRIGKMPKGPCLQFKVNSYALVKDVQRILKHPKSVGRDSAAFHEPPLLVMNGFKKVSEAENHERLMITILQNLFPPIQPQTTKVNTIKRVLLISKREDGEIELRHYAIDTKMVEESRNIKKLINSHQTHKKLPIMTKAQDISDLILDPYAVGGQTSDSEVEDDAVVEVKNEQNNLVRKKAGISANAEAGDVTTTRKRAIKLTELGPRINMNLVKIEDSMIGGKTIYHSRITKTKKEEAELEKRHQKRQQEKAERRKEQKANVDAKLAKKQAKKARKLARKNGEPVPEGEGDASGENDDSGSDSDAPEINPSDYENDSDLFSE